MWSNAPKNLSFAVSSIVKNDIQRLQSVGGGDTNNCYLATTAQKSYFIKVNQLATGKSILTSEKRGLELISKIQGLSVPKVFGLYSEKDFSALVLEYLPSGDTNYDFWNALALMLSKLHQQTNPKFGLEYDNYIGTVAQRNTYHSNWHDFYYEERLAPLFKSAYDKSCFDKSDYDAFNRLSNSIPQVLPVEKPSLIHGDFWSGNYYATVPSKPVLIDPCVCYGHREMDIAMSLLFGGFDLKFYSHYEEFLPMEAGWRQRMDLYQLYYILVHVLMFGGGYVSQSRRIIKKYA